ncbi:MAG: methyl-accepting chemotaxis protein [Pseudomonadota bacterium]
MKKNLPITNVEQSFSDDANILSTTDLKGAITYVNRDFIDISGFEVDELIGKNHNVVRHPEMPPAAFEDLWKTVKSQNSWMGIVKNRCKNGDHYWVSAYVTPIVKDGSVVEYQSIRSKPEREDVKRAERLYAKLMDGQAPAAVRKRGLGLGARLLGGFAVSLLLGLLAAVGLTGMSPGSALAVFVVAMTAATALSLWVLQPLQGVVKKARSVSDNLLTQYVYTGRNDDVGQLLYAIRMLESESGGLIGRMADSAKQLTENARKVVESVSSTSQGVQQQYSETDQVATAVNEMSASIQEVASNAQQTAESANAASNEAGEGRQVVNETMATISSLADEVEQAAGVIKRLEADSNEISTIVDTIQAISEQTNLLALNAAIEAARAGEQGRGFAVVADEVRSLAGRTHNATDEIKSKIDRLLSGSRDAVSVMEHSREQATASVDQAGKAVNSLEAIASAIDTINDMSTQIASAVEQQSSVADEINRSIMTIRDIAERTLEGSNESEAASSEMIRMSEGLDELAASFWNRKR